MNETTSWVMAHTNMSLQMRGCVTDLCSAVKRCTCKSVSILWIESNLHDIVWMPLKDLSAHPPFVPVPKLYQHVIRWWQHIWKSWMDCYTSDVISMSLKNFNFVHGIVVVDTNEHIICTGNNPLFPWHKFCRPHWNYVQIHTIQLSRFQIPLSAQLLFTFDDMYVVYLAALKLRMISPWSERHTKTNILNNQILWSQPLNFYTALLHRHTCQELD